MTTPKSLSERLRRIAGGALEFEDDEAVVREAADALDAQTRAADAEIALLKEGRMMHDEHADHLEHELAAKDAEIARLTAERANRYWEGRWRDADALLAQAAAALEQIDSWSRAYPLAVFLKPDLNKARELLEAGGMTLASISADAMRHVVDGVGEIAREALAAIRASGGEEQP